MTSILGFAPTELEVNSVTDICFVLGQIYMVYTTSYSLNSVPILGARSIALCTACRVSETLNKAEK